MTTGFGSATRAAEVRPGDDVVVVGLGGVGTAAVLGAASCGAHRIFAVDPVAWKRDQVLKFGATHAYADIDTWDLCHHGDGQRCGNRRDVESGIAHSASEEVAGNIFGGGNPQHDIPLLLSMYRSGKLNLDDMVTRRYSLEQINEGHSDMLEGKNIRGVITFDDADG